MNYYSLKDCEKLIDHYLKSGGEMTVVEEGSLGLGTVVLKAKGKKTAVIQERFKNQWSSHHTIRLWNKTPKKYQSC